MIVGFNKTVVAVTHFMKSSTTWWLQLFEYVRLYIVYVVSQSTTSSIIVLIVNLVLQSF